MVRIRLPPAETFGSETMPPCGISIDSTGSARLPFRSASEGLAARAFVAGIRLRFDRTRRTAGLARQTQT